MVGCEFSAFASSNASESTNIDLGLLSIYGKSMVKKNVGVIFDDALKFDKQWFCQIRFFFFN